MSDDSFPFVEIPKHLKKMVNDYHLKSCIFVDIDVLWITGSKK